VENNRIGARNERRIKLDLEIVTILEFDEYPELLVDILAVVDEALAVIKWC
jgi:hypothetical protein